jgi:SAM-dependent methyltransferase
MSHPSQMQYIQVVKDLFSEHFLGKQVLEVGSLNINGTVRDFFTNCYYVGIDVAAGKDVDVVCEGQNFNAPTESFDVVISCECFEHNPHWISTFQNMYRMVRPGGIVIMTCATTGRAEHGTTRSTPQDSPLTIGLGWDYYKNLEEKDFREHFNIDSMFRNYEFRVNGPVDLYFYGIK